MTRFARTGAKLGSTLASPMAETSEGNKAQIPMPVRTTPALILSSGILQALKWLALLLMTLDSVNKYLLHASVPELFTAGRLALPLFAFVRWSMVATRARLAGWRLSAASPPFHSSRSVDWVGGWWPFNFMSTLLVATVCARLIEVGGQTVGVAARERMLHERQTIGL